jgi:2,5-diamino-6-(ribosylamino)-4(3H)-pyrimidinone 5'-phosphate reductase
MSTALELPASVSPFLSAYLPPASPSSSPDPLEPEETEPASRPFVTLTYATSLDSHLSIAPGVQTALSGPESKALTHHLRTFHDAILIGASTAVADDPGLNSRLPGTTLSQQPRPIILDPTFRWQLTRESRVLRTTRDGQGLAPWVFVAKEPEAGDVRVGVLEEVGGQLVVLEQEDGKEWGWEKILAKLAELGIKSVMVEGGARVANGLLKRGDLVDSVVVTVAPVYLGKGGVNVSPEGVVRFRDVAWCTLGRDVVMAGRVELVDGV